MSAVRTWACVCALALLAACGDGSDNKDKDGNNNTHTLQGDKCEPGQATCEITQNITTDTTWTEDHVYVLRTNVFVKDATLKIEAGTVIQGNLNTSLAITSTARIDAQGTASSPIIFTSAAGAGSRRAGDWGGIVLLGKAPINVQGGVDNIEGYPESADTQYGGSDAAHDCGTIKYARIEFAGFRLGGNNELNGLTLGGCGTGTVIDYVQVHRGLDDGVEMFGGTANLKHIVITLPDDDGLDWDQGWTGKGQFIIVQQSLLWGNHGIEADNSSSSPNATPRSNPELWNVTLIGSNGDKLSAAQKQGGAALRVGTAGSINNAIFAYFNDFAVDVAGADSIREASEGRLTLKHTTFWSTRQTYDATNFKVGSDFDEWSKFGTEAEPTNTVVDPTLTRALYTAPTAANPKPVPDFKPGTALAGGTPPADGFFEAGATFRGAVGDTPWLADWTAFPEN